MVRTTAAYYPWHQPSISRMELVAENGCTICIARGCKKDLGRGPELAITDRTVSRHHVTVELLGPLAGRDGNPPRLEVKVLGANPVCIMHTQKAAGMREGDQQMVLLRKGEVDILALGDKISLSLNRPMFITVRADGKQEVAAGSSCLDGSCSNAVAPMNTDCPDQLAEDNLLGKWRDRKKHQETRASCTNVSVGGDVGVGCLSPDQVAATNEEEEGMAQAVARRQRRALERRLQKEREALQDDFLGAEASMSKVLHADAIREEIATETSEMDGFDPVKDFGFLVEGSEFDQYKNRHRRSGSKWVWPPLNRPRNSLDDEDDDDQQHEPTSSRRKKARKEDDDDDEWRGDDQDEKASVANAKKSKLSGKVNLRAHPTNGANKLPAGRVPAASHSKAKRGRQEEDEDEGDEGEGDDTLGGFIVNDDEEVIESDDSDEEEEEACDDDEADEEDEEDDEDKDNCHDKQLQDKKSKKEQEKPLCKYGKSCYRKNKDHLSQYQH